MNFTKVVLASVYYHVFQELFDEYLKVFKIVEWMLMDHLIRMWITISALSTLFLIKLSNFKAWRQNGCPLKTIV